MLVVNRNYDHKKIKIAINYSERYEPFSFHLQTKHQSTRSLPKDLRIPRTNLSKSFPMSILVRKILSYYHDQSAAEFLPWLRAILAGARNTHSAHSHKQYSRPGRLTRCRRSRKHNLCWCVAPLLFQWQFILIPSLWLDSISSKVPAVALAFSLYYNNPSVGCARAAAGCVPVEIRCAPQPTVYSEGIKTEFYKLRR